MSGVALGVGVTAAIAKAVLKLKLSKEAAVGAVGLVDALNLITQDVLGTDRKARKAARFAANQFEEIGEEIAKSLEETFKRTSISEGALHSIGIAFGKTLNYAALSSETLAEFSLDADALCEYLRAFPHPEAIAELKDLREDERVFYDRLLLECSRQLITVASKLPDFTGAVFAEVLQRQDVFYDSALKSLHGIRQDVAKVQATTARVEEKAGEIDESVKELLRQAQEKATQEAQRQANIKAIRQTLLKHMAGWRRHNVFGNIKGHPNLEDIPLEALYVEPRTEMRGFVLGAITKHLKNQNVVVVSADFGHGKSLTARTLAWTLAERYLNAPEGSKPTFPVFVECAKDFMGSDVELERACRNSAHRRYHNATEEDLKIDNEGFAPPQANEPALFVFDGLDEAVLGQAALESLFGKLKRFTGGGHQAVVFSRPMGLPSKLENVPVLELDNFNNNQIDDWITKWTTISKTNQLNSSTTPLSPEALRDKDLLELVRVPILLFMVAYTWGEYARDDNPPTRADIYETFCLTLARGKYEHDRQENKRIAKASEVLCDRLVELGELEKGANPLEAMLWLMARIAWKVHELDKEDEGLERRHIQNVIGDELKIKNQSDTVHTVCTGVLLALQANLESGNNRFLFGHKSFREYLVAWFWAHRLRRISHANEREWPGLLERLLDARLMRRTDECWRFLKEILNNKRWEGDRDRLAIWAKQTSHDGGLGGEIREAALFVGFCFGDREGFEIKHQALRSVIAWFWIQGGNAWVWAQKTDLGGASFTGADLRGAHLERARLQEADLRGAYLEGAYLEGVNLTRAYLQGADLEGADLEGANLRGVDLTGANLKRAYLERVDLERADLERADLAWVNLKGANLRGVNLEGANLRRVNLTGANLRGVNLTRAYLQGAYLQGAYLEGAYLQGTYLQGAFYDINTQWPEDFNFISTGAIGPRTNLAGTSLERTYLRGANLRGANLRGVDLTGAYLQGVDLTGAYLQGVDLTGAYLAGANLQMTDLEGADLRGAFYDIDTQWPEGFNFISTGAIGPGANLRGADLEGADLTGTLLDDGGTFFRVEFQEADLEGADLRGANLRGANLERSRLEGAHLQGATYNQSTIWPANFDPKAAGAILVSDD